MKNAFILSSILALGCVAPLAGAHDLKGHEETIGVLQMKDLPSTGGKQALMAKVTYAPGTKSAGHSHPGPVFAYVLEGEVESQLDDGPVVVYKAGQSWYEAPGARHLVSRNASKTLPATLLVWIVKGPDEAPVLPLSQEQH